MEQELKKWAVQWDAGMRGTDAIEFITCYTQEEAEDYFIDAVHDHIDSYSCHWDDEDEGEDLHAEAGCWAEEYDPDKHDMLVPGGLTPSFVELYK
jgi:hypothetical protein